MGEKVLDDRRSITISCRGPRDENDWGNCHPGSCCDVSFLYLPPMVSLVARKEAFSGVAHAPDDEPVAPSDALSTDV